MLTSHCGAMVSVPGDFLWDSWWKTLHSGKLSYSPIIIIPPFLHVCVSPSPEVCNNHDHEAFYHTHGLSVGGFTSDLQLGWLQNSPTPLNEMDASCPLLWTIDHCMELLSLSAIMQKVMFYFKAIWTIC